MNSTSVAVLSMDELYDITAGESVWYYIFYGLGYFAHAYTDSQLAITNAVGNGRR